jgi:hypothetical protein
VVAALTRKQKALSLTFIEAFGLDEATLRTIAPAHALASCTVAKHDA